jgi:hypothetical protein
MPGPPPRADAQEPQELFSASTQQQHQQQPHHPPIVITPHHGCRWNDIEVW